jgi:2-hydroxy-6-oxonona-2,4-dienedioate hydrolase
MATPHTSLWTDLQGVAFEQAYVDVDGVRTRYLHAGQRASRR